MVRRPRFTRLPVIAGTLALLAAMALPTAMSAAPPPIRFSLAVNIPGECIAVFTAANSATTVTLRSSEGYLKAQGTIPADELWFCLDSETWIESGDKVKATDATDSRTFVVPEVSIEVNRVTDRFEGTGPAGRTVRVQYPTGIFSDVGKSVGVRVGQDGHWKHNPHLDLIGGSQGAVSLKTVNDDRISAYAEAPSITVNLDRARFSGWIGSFDDVEIALGSDGHGGATGDATGSFGGQFRDQQGHLRPASPGDQLVAPSLAADADWIVPEIEGGADTSTDMVSGRCHDAGSFSGTAIVEDYRTGHRRGWVILNPEADGSFEFDFGDVGNFFADPANVKHGDTLVVRCMQNTGDWVQRSIQVP